MKRSILVCGFGRCGSSLMMQMLAAGGVPCMGSYPDYECTEVCHRNQPRFWKEATGKAVKVIDPHKFTPPILHEKPIIIWMKRSYYQQSKSQAKFFSYMTGMRLSDAQRERFEESYILEDMTIDKVLPGRIIINFEDVITDPLGTAEKLAQIVPVPFDVMAATSVVYNRPTTCLEGLLELELLARAEAAK